MGLFAVCGAKYKTRPGLVYHYGHIHKENASDGDSRDSSGKPPPAATANSPVNSEGSNSTSNSAQPQPQTQQQQSAAKTAEKIDPKAPATEYQDSYVTFLNSPTSAAPAGTFFVKRIIQSSYFSITNLWVSTKIM